MCLTRSVLLTCMFVREGAAWQATPSHWENIWLRTKRYDANGKVRSGTGGVCYLYWPTEPGPGRRRVLQELGLV